MLLTVDYRGMTLIHSQHVHLSMSVAKMGDSRMALMGRIACLERENGLAHHLISCTQDAHLLRFLRFLGFWRCWRGGAASRKE